LKHFTRCISFVIVFCYIVAASFPIQSYGASDNSIIDNGTLQKNNSFDTSNSKQSVDKTDKSTNPPNEKSTDSSAKSDNGTTDKPNDKTPSKPIVEPSKTADTKSNSTTSDETEANGEESENDQEALWYRKQNPMKKEHQQLLWEYCKKRNLSYIDMLALIYTESNFDEKCVTGNFYGYFQISKGNCANLAKALNTKNEPLNGAININWGTAMYSNILADKRVKDLEGKMKRDVALSIYQRGTGGYDKYGISKSFLKTYYQKWDKVNEWFNEKEK